MFKKRHSIEEVEEGKYLSPKFDENGLIPVVTSDYKNGDILMHGYMNQESLKKTIETTRKETLKKSRAVIRGQATEHLAPFILKDTNPKDYRFLGNPVDYIHFEGLSNIIDRTSDEITSVNFIDIKTGSSSLNKNQRRIRDAIQQNRVQFLTINLDEEMEKQNDSTFPQEEIELK